LPRLPEQFFAERKIIRATKKLFREEDKAEVTLLKGKQPIVLFRNQKALLHLQYLPLT